MKILVDMNLSPDWIEFLGDAGFEAIHWSEIGPHDAPDTDLIEWATKNGHVILTSDLDFGAILAAANRSRPSVVQVRSDILAPSAIGHGIVRALRQAGRQLSQGALVSVDAARARLRILPMNSPDPD